jgi:hypothetical protein
MITMVIFVLVIAAGSQIFTGLLTQFKQQSKIAETNIEGIVGLEILRRDIEHAGYGLPRVVPATVAYNEASAAEAAIYNDCNGTAPCNPPRAILSGNNVAFGWPNAVFNGSDYLVTKATNVARNATAQRWTHLSVSDVKRLWDIASENFADDDRLIVLSPGTSAANYQSLVVSGGAFSTTYNATAGFAPTDNTETRFIYGINNPSDDDSPPPPRMPFNRADYYIWRAHTNPTQDEVPDRCAPNTGVLRKAVISHADGGRRDVLPLLDCVADLQVIYRRDTDDDGTIDNTTDDISALTTQQIRDQVKEIRVYILAHEGQRDVNYTQTPTTIYVGDPGIGGGRNFNIGTNVNYRWKLYTLVVKPNNLR